MGYQFEIQYQPGCENKAADALSQVNSSVELITLSVPPVLQLDILAKEVQDPQLLRIIKNWSKISPAISNIHW